MGEELTQAAGNEINGVMMREIHGCPPDPKDVQHEDGGQFGEEMAHEQGLHGGIARMQARESAKDLRTRSESARVHVNAKELVNGGETGGRTGDAVVCGSQTVHVFIPRRTAGEDELYADSGNVHPAKGSHEGGRAARRSKDEEDCRDDSGSGEVRDAIWEPGQNIQDYVLVGGQDVAEIGAIEDVFQRGQDANPGLGANSAWNESGAKWSASAMHLGGPMWKRESALACERTGDAERLTCTSRIEPASRWWARRAERIAW
jgi:hypothetical protein